MWMNNKKIRKTNRGGARENVQEVAIDNGQKEKEKEKVE